MKGSRFGWMLALLLLTGMAGTAAAQDKNKQKKGAVEKIEGQSSVSVEIPAVTVNVVVTDKDGNLVTGLTRDFFKVYEDGVAQEITNFFPDTKAVNLVIVLEASRLIQGIERDFWSAMMDLIHNLRPDDYCALVTYDLKPRIAVDFTLDKNKIMNEANMSLYFQGFSESALSDAVTFVINRMHDVEGKKAVILLSTGLDTFSKTTYSKALDIAATSDTVIYAVSMGQLTRTVNDPYYSSGTLSDFMMADLRLKSFAKKTGGMAYFPRFPSEYPSVFRNINMYIRYQYTLAYRPTNQKPDGKNRKIKVEATADIDHDDKPDKLKVNHKEGYKVEVVD